MSFEAYSKTAPKRPYPGMWALTTTGNTLALSHDAAEAILKPFHVLLSYDRERSLIAVTPVNPTNAREDALRLNPQTRLVSLRGFCRVFKPPIQRNVRYAAYVEKGVLIVDLKTVSGEEENINDVLARVPDGEEEHASS